MKLILILLFISSYTFLMAQKRNPFYARKWKSYNPDYIFFDYLKLNKDGTGIKAIGMTINEKDKIKTEDESYLVIKDWVTKKDTLILRYQNHSTPDSFIIKKNSKIQFEAFGLHSIYPTLSISKKRENKIYEDYNVLESYYLPRRCFESGNPFKIKKCNKNLNKLVYSGFDNLIQQISPCFDFRYVLTIYDPKYTLIIPKKLNVISFGATSSSFSYTFSHENDSINTQIIIHYIFDEIYSEDNYNIPELDYIQFNNKKIYLSKNWKGLDTGTVFYTKNLQVIYYTENHNQETQLKKCITSLKFKHRKR